MKAIPDILKMQCSDLFLHFLIGLALLHIEVIHKYIDEELLQHLTERYRLSIINETYIYIYQARDCSSNFSVYII